MIELTIAMLIAAIVVGLAYRFMSEFTTAYGRQQQEKLVNYEQDLLIHRLRQDFDKADSVLYMEPDMDFYFENGIIRYSFRDSLVLRDQYTLRVDTFRLVHEQPVARYEQRGKMTRSKVSGITLTVWSQEKFIPLYFKKYYAATELIDELL